MTPSTTLVSGASAGIGEAVCRQLLETGGIVVNFDRSPPRIGNERLHYVAVDLADPVATQEAARDIVRRFEITALVNNAGSNRPALLEDVTMEDFDYLMNLHVRASLILAQAVLPAMRRAGHGRIVNIASRAVQGIPYRTVYGAAKSALIGFTRTWALELGADRITVNAVAPGPVETALWHKTDETVHHDPQGRPPANVLNSVLTRRMGTPAEVAKAVMYFLSPEAAFVTGQTLFICGGSSIGATAW